MICDSFFLLFVGFSAENPELKIEIFSDDRVFDLVKEGFDIALRVGKLKVSNLISLKISDISLLLVTTREYFQTHPRIKSVDQLAAHHFISFSKIFENNILLTSKENKTEKVSVNTMYSVNNPLVAKSILLNHTGISLLPNFLIYEELRSGKLLRVLPDMTSGSTPFHLVWPHHQEKSLKVKKFLEFSKESMKKYFFTKKWLIGS